MSKTMYKETLKAASTENFLLEPEPSSSGELSKVNRICDAFLQALKSRGSAHIQNVITAHVCKAPPDLDAGLVEIAKIRSEYLRAILHMTVDCLSNFDGVTARPRFPIGEAAIGYTNGLLTCM